MKKEMIRHTAVIALLTVIIACVIHWQLYQNNYQRHRLDITRKLSLIRGHLGNELSKSFLALKSTGDFISATPDLTEKKFHTYAALLLKNQYPLKNIAAAPDLIIRYVYPPEGNQAIMGTDYRDLPKQWPDVQKAVTTGQLVTAGPLKLIQGGTGLIGRVPVYRPKDEGPRLWGLVSSIIDMDQLYQAAGIPNSDMGVALRKIGPPFITLYGDLALFDPETRAVTLPLDVPGGRWELAAVPETGWSGFSFHILLADLVLLLMGTGTACWRIRAIREAYETNEIRNRLDTSQAISHLGSWAFDLKTGDLWWSDETYRIFGLEKAGQIPTRDLVLTMIHEQDREQVDSAINKAVGACGGFLIEHRILRADGETVHVEARGFVHIGPDKKAYKISGTVLDITPRKTMENDLRAREEQMRAMAKASHDALIMIDASDRVLFWSDTAEKMFGWTSAETVGRRMHQFIVGQEDHEKAMAGLRQFSKTGTGLLIDAVTELTAVRKDKRTIPVELSVSAFRIADTPYAVGSLRDISDRKKKEEQLQRLATTDELTGLYNRRRFLELIQKELKKCRRYAAPLSVIMFDADKFKRINDTFGHEAGDRVLEDISRVTTSVIRETDFPGRLGGEEFAVCLPSTDTKGAVQLAQRIRAAFEASAVVPSDGTRIHYTASFGVACCLPDEGIEVKTLMKQADKALYQAKANGRNRVEVFRTGR